MEAFAKYFDAPVAVEAVREAPLLKFSPEQVKLIGADRVAASYACQMKARGLTSTSVEPGEGWHKFVYWVPRFLGDPCLPMSDWVVLALQNFFVAVSKFGNHKCLALVCYKGRWAKLRFCRMLYWHWVKALNKKKSKLVMKRVHGLPLQDAWDGTGFPPVYTAPPYPGMPALEMTFPFHCKITPGVLLAARCNHDLGVLW